MYSLRRSYSYIGSRALGNFWEGFRACGAICSKRFVSAPDERKPSVATIKISAGSHKARRLFSSVLRPPRAAKHISAVLENENQNDCDEQAYSYLRDLSNP
mmetsp:Transcript_5944/g.7068  ORF Transcript_5944/g.7068 Transcript_5944/m.7068 type:complete len:101 (-) Transcript_5944:156-458(-)